MNCSTAGKRGTTAQPPAPDAAGGPQGVGRHAGGVGLGAGVHDDCGCSRLGIGKHVSTCDNVWYDKSADKRHPGLDHMCKEDRGHLAHYACICACRVIRGTDGKRA